MFVSKKEKPTTNFYIKVKDYMPKLKRPKLKIILFASGEDP